MHTITCGSSGYSTGSVPLYMQPLALHWLSALYIALRWLPIALIWLPQLGSSSHELHIGSRFATPTLAPYTGSHQRGSSLQGLVTRLVIELHPPTQAPYTASQSYI